MFAAELAASSVWHSITLALVHFLWQGVAIAAGLAIVVELLALRRPQTRYACSLAALLLMVACPGITAWWCAEGTGNGGQGTGVRSQATAARGREPGASCQQIDAIAAAQPYVLPVWLAGVALFGGRLLVGIIGVRKLRRGRLPLPRDLAERAARLGRPLSLRAESLVFLSRHVTDAIAIGFVRPIVLIPAAWATEMPLAMLEAVIAHELAHVQRRDLWVNLLQRIVETLLFYHPAVWWLSRRLRAEREMCCDELAVALTGRRLEYVQALETVARRSARVEPLLAAGIRGERNMQLLARVRNVLGLSAVADRSRLWPAGLIALLLPLVAWGWSAGFIAPQTTAALADDDRDDEDDDRDDREDDDDDDDDDAKEGRRERGDREDDDDDKDGDDKDGDDDDDDDEKEIRKVIRREADDDDDRREKGDREKEGRDDEANFFNKKEVRIRVDGDKKDPGSKEGEIVKKPGPKDGDIVKKPGLKGDIVKKPGIKDGDAVKKSGPKEGGEDKIVRRDGDRLKIELKRRANEDERFAELVTMVKKLTAENERLQAEVFKLRGGKKVTSADEKEATRDKELLREKDEAEVLGEKYKRAAAERKEFESRERKIKDLQLKGRLEEARKLGEARKEEAAEKEATEYKAKVKETLTRDLAEKVRDQARAAAEQARAAAQKAEEQARRAVEEARKALDEARDEKRQ